jgi:four helix bundle protein
MRRAAVSVACNIVEGCARFSQQKFLRFLDTAYGSSRELEYQLSLAHRLGYLSDRANKVLQPLVEEVGRTLHGLIKALRVQK